MGAKTATDELVAMIARRQHGVVSIRQLHRAGVSRGAVRRRVETGRLHRLHRGVYAVGHRGVSAQGRGMAAILACARREHDAGSAKMILDRWGVALSHRSAAALWDLLPWVEGPVHVSVPGSAGREKRAGIRVHRCRSLLSEFTTLRVGIPVTTPARTISYLRRVISPRELRRAIRQAEMLGMPIGDEVERDRTRSDLERDFLRLCRCHRLPKPEVNVQIGVDLVDFLWRDRRLIVETDGYVYHRGRVAFEDDRRRDLRLRAAGYDVVRVSESQVDEEPGRVAEVVRAALRVGADADEREDRGG